MSLIEVTVLQSSTYENNLLPAWLAYKQTLKLTNQQADQLTDSLIHYLAEL